jgi:4-amino-4-deoxy-L-arabinose transferase-like glycosyltransferase
VFGIGKRLFNENVGYISALICAFYPYFIFYCVFLMSETFVIFFLALSVYFYARIREKNERLNSVLLGMSLGLTFLSRSIVLGLIPVMLFFLLIENWRKYLYPAFIALVFFCLTISPWIIRNYNLWGEFVLLSTRGGYNLWFRNNPYYYEDELTALGEKVPKNILDGIQYREFLDYPQFSPEQNEIVRNRILTQEGIKFIKANPQLIKYLCWFRFKSLLGVQGVLAQGLIYKVAGFLTFGILFPLGVLAFLLDFKKWRVTFPLMAIFAYFIAVYTLTHDGIRYRLPADPYIIILASVIITGIVEWAYRKLIIDK